jgi:hypothetical protein
MDKITINQNVFVEIKDKSKNSDLSILPVQVNLEFLAKQRVGPKLKYGTTQEVKVEYLNNTFDIQDC